jgi:putative colanic acid biosynthesis acetyltransferase WcaF
MRQVDLGAFDNSWYKPGRPLIVQLLWYFFGSPLLESKLLPGSFHRRLLLRAFGAAVGEGVVIKPGVRVKYPWKLKIGNHSWIGEDAWIDNLGDVVIGDNVCISQGVYVCTGSHDMADPKFGLVVKGVEFRPGSWAGAFSVIYPGVVLEEGGIAAGGSVVRRNVGAWEVHGGNPARQVASRKLRE